MPEKPEQYVTIGKFGKPHGLKGWITVIPATQSPQDIATYLPWHTKEQNTSHEIPVDDVQNKGQKIIAHIKNIDDIDSVKPYTNKLIYIPRTRLPALSKDEYYWADLEGLTVINREGVTLGTVEYLFTTGHNDVMVVEGERQHLIPFLRPQTVLSIDLTQKTMTVDWDPEF